MKKYSLTHLSDESLRRELFTAAASEKEATAELLAHIAEFDHRKLFLPAAHPLMLDYCMVELRLSEEAAKKRIRVARAGHACPGVFEALASGRVHLGGLVVLAGHLSPQNASELLAAATHKSREAIERLVKEERTRIREQKEAESRLQPHEEEVVPWICALGVRENEARIAAKRCHDMAGTRLEDRVKRALSFFGARISRTLSPVIPAMPATPVIPGMPEKPVSASNVGTSEQVGGAPGAFAAGE